MKKIQRILALLTVILLLGLYGCTLIFAIIDNPNTMNLFQTSLYASVVLPALIYIYTLIYRIIHKKDNETDMQP